MPQAAGEDELAALDRELAVIAAIKQEDSAFEGSQVGLHHSRCHGCCVTYRGCSLRTRWLQPLLLICKSLVWLRHKDAVPPQDYR